MLYFKCFVTTVLLMCSQHIFAAQPKHVIAVLPFENRVQGTDTTSDILGNGMGEMLTTELVKAGNFVVIEQNILQDIVRKQDLAMSGSSTGQAIATASGMAGAQFYIRGAITEFNPESGGSGISMGWDIAKIASNAQSVYLAIDVRIVDNASGQIFASHTSSGRAQSKGSSVTSNISKSDDLNIGFSRFSNTAVGLAAREALQGVIGFINAEARSIPWQGSIIKADRRQAYINRGASADIRVNDIFHVYSKGEPLIDPDTGFNLGSDEEYLCEIKVTSVKPKFSVARRSPDCKGLTISRGDIIRTE